MLVFKYIRTQRLEHIQTCSGTLRQNSRKRQGPILSARFITTADYQRWMCGSTAKVGVQNGSELSSLVVVPLRQTSFVTPPDSTRQSYMFLGSDALGSFQLNPLVVPHSEGTVGKRAGIPSNAYCNRLLKQSSQSWVSWYHRGIEKLNVGQRYVFKSSRPNLPIGYLAPRGGCPTRLMGLNTQQVQQPGVWINDPKTMEIVALSKDHTVTTLRGPGGGLVCIGSSMFFPPKP